MHNSTAMHRTTQQLVFIAICEIANPDLSSEGHHHINLSMRYPDD